MICSSLRHRGDELLAQNAGVAAYAERGATMGIPLLYPWANRLAGFDYSVDGRTVQVPHDPARVALDDNGLPIHGVIGGRLAWELTRPPGPDESSLAARLSWSASEPELFEVFPFRHDLLYEARLGGGRLELQITVHACGADSVPLAFGFHPYLSPAQTPREGWLVELPPMRPLALDANQIPIGPEQPLAAQRFELAGREFDDGFDSVSEPARFAVVGAGRRIEVELLEGYPCAQVFAPRDGAVHLLRADDRAGQRAAQRHGPAAAPAGRALPRGVLGAALRTRGSPHPGSSRFGERALLYDRPRVAITTLCCRRIGGPGTR